MLDKFFTLGNVLPPVNSRLRTVFNEHYDYLLNHKDTIKHVIDPHVAFISNYNLYRYMKEKGFVIEQIYPTIVINNYQSLYDFNDKQKEIFIPSMSAIEQIKSSMI